MHPGNYFLKSNLVALLFVSLLVFGCRPERHDLSGTLPASHFEQFEKWFPSPRPEYSTAPFWVWNDEVTRDKIDKQLEQFREQAVYQVIIHPRPGLITEYLSYDWLKLVKYAVDKGKELGMLVWLYDENSYPSGFAGGHVPAKMSVNADPVAGLKMHKLQILTETARENYVIVLKRIGNTFANISSGVENYLDQEGDYYAFSKWYYPTGEGWYGGFSYVDLLAMGITEKFISETMTGYEEMIGSDFGSTVPGIFTDEPHINAGNGDPMVVKFTPILLNRFSERFDYPLENYLPCLLEEVGDWKNVRHDYYAVLLDLFIERWSKPWLEYADSNNLLWTGHYWEHDWPDPRHGPDNMAMYAWHQVPGIDMLFNLESPLPTQFGNVRAVKELSSVANQLNKKRSLSETYGGAGWELTFEDMKRLGDWEYVLGVNLMNQHLSYMTIKGARKRDYPQSFSEHSPWFKHYKYLGNYFNRLSYALTAGEQVNPVLILEPTTTAWMYATPNGNALDSKKKIQEIRSTFHTFLQKLEKNQVEYDLGCEDIIRRHGSVEGKTFIVGDRKYDLVVIPPLLENLEVETFNLLLTYLENGGQVVSYDSKPGSLDGNQSRKMSETWDRYSKHWEVLADSDIQWSARAMTSGQIDFENPEGWGGEVYHHTRQLEDGWLLFFTNFHQHEKAEVSFDIPHGSIIECDPVTGQFYRFPSVELEDRRRVHMTLPPAGSLLLFIGNIDHGYKLRPASGDQTMVVPSGNPDVKPLSANAISLDYCDLSLPGKTMTGIYYYQAESEVYKYYLGEIYGSNYNPWSNAVQYKSNILDKGDFSGKPGFEVAYTFNLEDGFEPLELKAAIEWGELYLVSLNGISLEEDTTAYFLDQGNRVYNVTGKVKPGENKLVLHAEVMNIHAEIQPVYLIGDFRLASSDRGWVLTAPGKLNLGPWKDQGWPFYSGDMAYSKELSVEKGRKYHVKLNEWKGTLASVKVNGREAGIIGWEPYELDVTGYLDQGQNSIEVIITGSTKNLLGPHHGDIRKGIVTPWSFIHGPDNQPPGQAYDQLPYGLIEDFDILVGK